MPHSMSAIKVGRALPAQRPANGQNKSAGLTQARPAQVSNTNRSEDDLCPKLHPACSPVSRDLPEGGAGVAHADCARIHPVQNVGRFRAKLRLPAPFLAEVEVLQ